MSFTDLHLRALLADNSEGITFDIPKREVGNAAVPCQILLSKGNKKIVREIRLSSTTFIPGLP